MIGLSWYRGGRSPLPGSLTTRRVALSDARKEVPHGDEPAQWIWGLSHTCRSWAERHAADWCRTDRKLLARWLALQAALQYAGAELGKARRTEEQREEERAREARLSPDQQNPMGDSLSTGWYLAGMAGVALLEFPLVLISFTAFGLSPIFTGLLSLLSAVITAVLGHAVGTLSRHLRLRPSLMLLILLLLSIGFAVSLAWLREEALDTIRSDTATLDPGAAALALFVISLASLAVVALLAWHHGVDPADRDLYKARCARRRMERQVERLRRQLSSVESSRRSAREMARQEVRALGEAMLATAHRYAWFNQLHRDKHDLPPSLLDQNLPRLPMPEVLEQPLLWTPQEMSL